MKITGRKPVQKPWDTSYRHSFYTSFSEDPDLHVLMFISGNGMNAVIREALRDYMVKHASPATDRDFQRRVFLLASERTAAGRPPTGSEVLGELHQVGTTALPSTPPPTRQAATAPPPLPPAQVHVQPPAAVMPQESHPSPLITVAPFLDAPQNTPTQKRPVILDFGPEPEMGTEIAHSEAHVAQPKLSQRERWLARHKV